MEERNRIDQSKELGTFREDISDYESSGLSEGDVDNQCGDGDGIPGSILMIMKIRVR